MTTNSPVWDDGDWEGLPRLEGEITADVCVVGLGGSGLSCAGELLALGQRVVGITAGTVGGGAAGRNGGFLLAGTHAFYHDAVVAIGHERALRIYRLSMAELDRIAAETPDAVRRVGSLRIGTSPEELDDCRRQLVAMRADALPVEPYEGPEGSGLLFPEDGAFNPLLRCRLLARRAAAAGARLFERSRAVSLSGTEVVTEHGRVRCERVIVAVDGNLERVLPELADRTRTARLQMLACAPTAEVTIPRPVYARWGLDYWQQLPDGRIAVGGFRDIGGEAEWTGDPTPTAPVQDALEALLRGRLGVTAPITHRWAASVSFSTTGLPFLGEVRPSLWAIGAYSGTGNVLGALCGRGVAQLAIRGHSELAVAIVSD